MDDLQRIGVKLLCRNAEQGESGGTLPLVDVIPVFHRWIQQAAVPDLLIDVADYSHVKSGPGVLLVGYEGIYALDETDGLRGVTYYFRRPAIEGVAHRVHLAAQRALAACSLLESVASLASELRFDTSAIEIYCNDRLNAPNEPGTLEALAPAIEGLVSRLYPGAVPQLERRGAQSRERFSLVVRTEDSPGIETLLERVAN